MNQRLAVLCLEKLRAHVDVVGNGREALEQLKRLPYDVVLMDCQVRAQMRLLFAVWIVHLYVCKLVYGLT